MLPVVPAQLDYYAVLEITPAADVTEVNAAFAGWPGGTIPTTIMHRRNLQFQDINQAHQLLIDPVRRAEYDAR